MRVLKRDDYCFQYLYQKFYVNSLSGIIGKIFDLDEK
jgi:hypothetical protein